jgi:hypothetical protein
MADSRPKKEGTQELIKQLIEFFPSCGMEIRKFFSNTYVLISELKPELRIKDLHDDKTLKDIFDGITKPTKVKVLGLLWDYVKDVLGFDFSDIERCESPITKMKMLQQLHTLFEPMGILIPFLITVKLLVQECWRLGLAWKDSVPQTLEEQWFKWEDQIDQLKAITVKRVLIPGENPEKLNESCIYLWTLPKMYIWQWRI